MKSFTIHYCFRYCFEVPLCLMLLIAVPGSKEVQAQQRWAPGQLRPEFSVLEVRGEAQLWQASSQRVWTLTLEIMPGTGDQIATGADGYVRIGLDDGSQMEIFANAIVQLGAPRPSLLRLLDIFIGQVRIMIQRVSGKPNPHSFTTPTAVLSVRGTTFDVAVDETTATIVAVTEGAVQVENRLYQGQGVLVKQGYRTIVRPNELPAKPERFRGAAINFPGMEKKHGKHMDPQAGRVMMGSPSGTMHPDNTGDPAGTMGMPGGRMGGHMGTIDSTIGGTGAPGGGTGGHMGGMGSGRQKDNRH
ncbi:MAG: FecR domain-containing protein [Acidobacteria bacterium]|nr:FecR domain-containing protein [Acidobacteriota bacterium]